jgi:hypothetical protein
MSQEVYQVSYALHDAANGWQGNDKNGHIMVAPAAGDGGGIKILRAWLVNAAATGVGTTFYLSLQNWGTAGTAVEGTIGTMGGTATAIAADTPTAFTLTAAQQIIDAGEWIVLNKKETSSSDPTRAVLSIEYVMGN